MIRFVHNWTGIQIIRLNFSSGFSFLYDRKNEKFEKVLNGMELAIGGKLNNLKKSYICYIFIHSTNRK